MRIIPLRDLQTKGASILDGQLDCALVEGTKSSFFLIPVQKGFEQFQAGPSGRIGELVLDGEPLLFACPTVIEEYFEVLAKPRLAKDLFPPVWLRTLLQRGTLRQDDPESWPHRGPDADNLVFLALAACLPGRCRRKRRRAPWST